MNINVKLFAAARDALGSDSVSICLDMATPTVADLRNALTNRHPQMANIVAHSMFAINEEYTSDETQIPATATVVCIPPVSGG